MPKCITAYWYPGIGCHCSVIINQQWYTSKALQTIVIVNHLAFVSCSQKVMDDSICEWFAKHIPKCITVYWYPEIGVTVL